MVSSGEVGQEVDAGSVNAFIEALQQTEISAQLPPCPDWPDLN